MNSIFRLAARPTAQEREACRPERPSTWLRKLAFGPRISLGYLHSDGMTNLRRPRESGDPERPFRGGGRSVRALPLGPRLRGDDEQGAGAVAYAGFRNEVLAGRAWRDRRMNFGRSRLSAAARWRPAPRWRGLRPQGPAAVPQTAPRPFASNLDHLALQSLGDRLGARDGAELFKQRFDVELDGVR
jgi:hypothetical protein